MIDSHLKLILSVYTYEIMLLSTIILKMKIFWQHRQDNRSSGVFDDIHPVVTASYSFSCRCLLYGLYKQTNNEIVAFQIKDFLSLLKEGPHMNNLNRKRKFNFDLLPDFTARCGPWNVFQNVRPMRNSTVNIGSVYGPQRNRLSITLNKKFHIW